MSHPNDCFSTEELQRYLSEQLDAENEELVLTHVDHCSSCRQKLENLSDDDLVRNYFEAVRRENFEPEHPIGQHSEINSIVNSDRSHWLAALIDPSNLPQRFGKFELIRVLGSGGFGTVYLAKDKELGREVAVKIPHLLRLSPGFRRRFLREGKAAACLHHPNIVSVLEAGEWGNICYIVSEYIEGPTLREYMLYKPAGLEEREAVQIVHSLSQAVQHAHQKQVIHRDIKPSNVLLDQRSPDKELSFRPLLTDFGTARICNADRSATVDDMLVGTAPYMAPEQFKGEQPGTMCDIYALGVLLFELITGRPPIEGLDSTSVLHRVATMHSPDLHQVKPGVNRDLSAICSKCLERNPAARYASADQLLDDLSRFLKGLPTIARPLGPSRRVLRWCRRNPVVLSLAGAPILTLLIVSIGLLWHVASLQAVNLELEEATRQANHHRERAEASERNARGLLYAADMRLAELAWRKGDLGTARELVHRHPPSESEYDFRGLEWHFLNQLLRSPTETLAQHDEWLYCVAKHPDGQRFATAGSSGTIHIHQLETGMLIDEIDTGQIEINGLAYSSSGQLLASTGDDGSVKIWCDGKLTTQFEGHEGKSYGVVFLSGDDRLATCGTDARVKLWDVESGALIEMYEDHEDDVESIASSSSGRFLASVGKDLMLVVRDLEQKQLMFRVDTMLGTLADAAFSPDEKYVATVAAAGSLKKLSIFQVANGQLELERSNSDAFVSVSFSPKGDRIFTTDRGGNLKVWDLQQSPAGLSMSESPAASTIISRDRIFAAELIDSDNAILSVSKSGKVLLGHCDEPENSCSADVQTLAKRLGTDPQNTAMHHVCVDQDQLTMFVAVGASVAKVELKDPEQISLLFEPDGRRWDKVAISHHANLLIGCALSDPIFATDGNKQDAVLRVFKLGTGEYRDLWASQSVAGIGDLTISSKGDLIAMVVIEPNEQHVDKWLYVLETEMGKIRHRLPASAATQARFMPDGNSLIYGHHDDIVQLDLTTGRESRFENAHEHGQWQLTISNSGRWLATADQGRVIKLWKLPSMQLHTTLLGHAAQVSGLCFSEGDRTLLSSGTDGTIKAWGVDFGRFLMDLRSEQEIGVDSLLLTKQDKNILFIRSDKVLCHIKLSQNGM